MGRLEKMDRLEEGVTVTYRPSGERDAEVGKLQNPWIGDESPLDASFRSSDEGRPLMQRGIAFDSRTTVVWDEDAVQTARVGEPQPEVVALRSNVILRKGFTGPDCLARIDYLHRGALVASRYTFSDSANGPNDA